jgi:hypothetical protein
MSYFALTSKLKSRPRISIVGPAEEDKRETKFNSKFKGVDGREGEAAEREWAVKDEGDEPDEREFKGGEVAGENVLAEDGFSLSGKTFIAKIYGTEAG